MIAICRYQTIPKLDWIALCVIEVCEVLGLENMYKPHELHYYYGSYWG